MASQLGILFSSPNFQKIQLQCGLFSYRLGEKNLPAYFITWVNYINLKDSQIVLYSLKKANLFSHLKENEELSLSKQCRLAQIQILHIFQNNKQFDNGIHSLQMNQTKFLEPLSGGQLSHLMTKPTK